MLKPLLGLPIALLSALLAVGCSGAPPRAQSPVAGGAAAHDTVGDSYIIGPGDTLRVFVLRNPDLTQDVPVRPDGKISTPLASDIVAVGKSPSQLARDIEAALSEYVRNPTVSVIVSQPASAYSQIRVVGQAIAPKAIPFRKGMTVLDVMIQVGGLGQFAAGNRAKIVRTVGGKSEQIKVRLEDLLDRGDVTQNLPMQAGDVLVIPESRF